MGKAVGIINYLIDMVISDDKLDAKSKKETLKYLYGKLSVEEYEARLKEEVSSHGRT